MANITAALGTLLLGIYHTTTGLPRGLLGHKPIRIDLPIPGFPVDVVLVSDPDQIQVGQPALQVPCNRTIESSSSDYLLNRRAIAHQLSSTNQCTAALQAFRAHSGFARMHEVPSKLLPPWVHLYFSGTRFWDTAQDQWFVPFNGNGTGSGYTDRRGAIDSLLATGFRPADVTQVRQQDGAAPGTQTRSTGCSHV